MKDIPNANPLVDDVILANREATMEEAINHHRKDFEAVMKAFRVHQLVCDMSKVQMFTTGVEF